MATGTMKSPRFLLTAGVSLILLVAAWISGTIGRLGAALKSLLVQLLEYIQGLDPVLAAVTFVGLYIAATVLFVPGLLITMAGGLLFGVVKGTALVSIASVCGASLAFLIGRYLARDWVAGKTRNSPRFRAIDGAIGKEGAKVVFLLRLSPIFPYNLLNYALGLTRVSFGRYVLASWIGMFPGTLLYVYLGSLAGSIATLATGSGGGGGKSTSQWILFGVGLLATVVVTVYVTRIARRALNQQLAVSAR